MSRAVRIAPPNRSTGDIVITDEPGRFLGIAPLPFRLSTKLRFARAARCDIDAVGVGAAVSGDGPKDGAGELTDELGGRLRSRRRRVEVAERLEANHRRARDGYDILRYAEAVSEIRDRQIIVAVFRRGVQEAGGVRRLVFTTPADLIVPAKQVRDMNFRPVEIDAGDLHHDIKNIVSLCADAERSRLCCIPTPRRVSVGMIAIRTGDVRSAIAPADAEFVENVGLASLDRHADVDSAHVALGTAGHHGTSGA